MAKKEIIYNGKTYQLSYELVHPTCSQAILFLHGWGSNKEIMKQAFGKTFAEYQHIYLDLPGFGQSSVEEIIVTADYAAIVRLFLKELGISPHLIFGHSFGGKVATLLKPSVLVLLSSAGIVITKSFKVRCKIALFKLLKPFAPKHFYRFFATKDVDGMSQRMYEILKRVVNEDFTEYFEATTSKTAIFWGISDSATPLYSGEKIHSLIKNSQFTPQVGDHFFFIQNSKNIEKVMLEFLK